MATLFDQEQGTQPDPEKTPKRWPWIVGIVAALFIGVGLGMGGQAEPEVVTKQVEVEVEPVNMAQRREALDSFAAELDKREAAVEQQQSALYQREKSLDEREAALTATERKIAANTIRDGIWTVGVDIKPGTYRATSVGSDCYWAITRAGSNGSGIINNGIPGGGNPQVTVTTGQDFGSQRCGEWRRQ